MRVLLTNDDGIRASGLEALRIMALRMGSSEDQIFTIAPLKNQSAKSRSITYKRSFNIEKISKNKYSVDGTPTDCIIFALDDLMKKNKPDIILSGVNYGYNLSEDVHYSGTVAAALEGSERGIMSFALSQSYNQENIFQNNYYLAKKHGASICLSIKNYFLQSSPFNAFNINFPIITNMPFPECVKVVPVGRRLNSNFEFKRKSVTSSKFIASINTRKNNVGSLDDDYLSCLNGFITISPLSLRVNDYEAFKKLEKVKFHYD
ncbi:5'/3'-nucleotidase SurE [Paracoccaceae bacterium]|nr:5'/3'-nucleotidase SurE [Paracoccaceae bacterium]